MPFQTEEKPFPTVNLGQMGLIKDVSLVQIPDNGFSEALNIRFRKGKLASAPGWSRLINVGLSDRIMHGANYIKTDLTRYTVLATPRNLWHVTDTDLVPVKFGDPALFTGRDSDLFSSTTAFNTFLITNGVDPIRKWTGSTGFGDPAPILGGLTDAEPGGVTVRSRIIVSFSDFIVLLHTIEDGVRYPFRVRWSRKGALEVWKNDVDGNGQAGYTDLDDTQDVILNALEITNSLAIYKENSIYMMSYISPLPIFSFRRVVTQQGLIAPRAVVDVRGIHLYVGQDNFYTFNGSRSEPFGDDKIKQWFFKNLNPTYRDRTIAFHYPEEDEVIFGFVSNSGPVDYRLGTPDMAAVYNYRYNVWAVREIPANAWVPYQPIQEYTWDTIPDTPWDSVVGSWDDSKFKANAPLILFGSEGQIQSYGSSFSKDGSVYTKLAQTGLKDFGQPGLKKRLQRLQVGVVTGSASVNLSVRVGHCANVGDTVTWEPAQTIALASGVRPFVDIDLADYYFVYEFSTVGKDDPWEVVNYTSWVQMEGFD